jgi:WD40 repeat protein
LIDKSPFKFLDAYTKEDFDIFFGRETEIEELHQKVFASKLLVVCGISGTGKTSLINCGLANKFEDSDWLPIYIRRGNDINRSFWKEIKQAAITPLPPSLTSIKKALQSVYLDHFKPLFLIFDQFEEIFIFGNREEQQKFIEDVKTIIESDVQCHLLFIIREEYLAEMIKFEKEIPDFLANRVRIEKMTRKNSRTVIEEPCRKFNIELEKDLPDRILERLSPESLEVELTYLQVLLDRLYKLARNDRKGDSGGDGVLRIAFSHLEEAGDVSDLLGSFLEEQINHMDDPETGLVILKAFVSIKGTKRQVTLEEVAAFASTLGKSVDQKEIKFLIENFIQLRILRDRDESGRYELRHDSLAGKIYEKITLVEKELLEVRQFIQNAYDNYDKRGIYLNQEDLKYIQTYKDRLFLPRELNDFIEISRKVLTTRKRSFNRMMVYSSVGFFLVVLFIGYYTMRKSTVGKSEDLAMRALIQKDHDPALAFKTALSVYETDTSSILAVKALFNAFYKLWDGGPYFDTLGNPLPPPSDAVFHFSPCSEKIYSARFSEDGKYIYGHLADNTVRVWDRSGKECFSDRQNHANIIAVYFAPDNRNIAAVDLDSMLIVWDLNGNVVLKRKIPLWISNPFNVMGFSPDKNIMACLGFNNGVDIYDKSGIYLYTLKGHKERVNCLDFSPDGRFMATGSNDSTIFVWKYNDSTTVFEKFSNLTRFEYKGAIWSLDFNTNSKYLMGMNSDTSWLLFVGKIGDTSETMFFHRYYSYKTDTYTPSPWNFTWPYHIARFTRSNAGIILSRRAGADSIDPCQLERFNDSLYFEHRIIFSDNSNWNLMPVIKNIVECKGCIQEDYYTYNGLDLSESGYIVSSITGERTSLLTHWSGLPLARLNGICPDFSPDDQYLLLIKGPLLQMYPAHEKEIINLAVNRKIFGILHGNESDWIHIYHD